MLGKLITIALSVITSGAAYQDDHRTHVCAGAEIGRPQVIAHRGGSIRYPQSSLAAYREQWESDQVDFLECDLTITNDGVLVCQHEPDLTKASNANRDQFRSLLPYEEQRREWLDPVVDFELSGRRVRHDGWHAFIREDARPSKGWYTPDYGWNETISKLSAPCASHQQCRDDHFPIATLEDLWSLVSTPSKGGSGIPKGLYLEIKHSTWHQSRRDIDLLEVFLSYLSSKSIAELPSTSADDTAEYTITTSGLKFPFPLYIQSFEVGDLIRLRAHLGYGAKNIHLVGLSTILHTTYNLPPSCCTEDRWLQRMLRQAFERDEDGSFVRLPGTFGEMFVGITASIHREPQLSGAPLNTLDCLQVPPPQHDLVAPFRPTGFLQSRARGQDQCAGCEDSAITGLKIVPVSLMPNTPELCDTTIKSFVNDMMLSCPNRDAIGQTYSLANPPAAFDLTCLVDALGLDLRYIRKYPEIVKVSTQPPP